MTDALRYIALGGLGEVGMNCAVFDFGDSAFLLDCGVNFPDVDHFGVLDARGLATARFTLPPLPVALNLHLHHAYGVFNGSTLLAGSNAIPLTITP